MRAETSGTSPHDVRPRLVRVPPADVTLPELAQSSVEAVVRSWKEQTLDLGRRPKISYVQVFENKGAAMGCSNPHPHSQVWATGHIPNEPAVELDGDALYDELTVTLNW